jgi:hypothetical protein
MGLRAPRRTRRRQDRDRPQASSALRPTGRTRSPGRARPTATARSRSTLHRRARECFRAAHAPSFEPAAAAGQRPDGKAAIGSVMSAGGAAARAPRLRLGHPSGRGAPRSAPSALRRTLLFDVGYRIGESAQVGVKRVQKAQEGVPADAAMSVLDLGDVGRTDIDADRQLLLRESGSRAQRPQRSTEDHVGVIVCLAAARSHPTFTDRLGSDTLGAPNIQVGARAGRTAGRRGTESSRLPTRRPRYQHRHVAHSPRAVLPEPPTTRRNRR